MYLSCELDEGESRSVKFSSLLHRMPYALRRGRCRNTQRARKVKEGCFWVVGPRGRKYSHDPIPRPRAEAQLRLLRAVEHGWVPDSSKTRKQKRRA